MFFFNSEEVYIGYSLQELSAVKEVLQLEGIKYNYKVVNHSAQGRGRFGSFGINSNYANQYIVTVKSRDAEKAEYLIDKTLHGRTY